MRSVHYFPFVQVIENIDQNHKLGLIYEYPTDQARIFVFTSDLFACKDEPEAKSLYKSMLNYIVTNK